MLESWYFNQIKKPMKANTLKPITTCNPFTVGMLKFQLKNSRYWNGLSWILWLGDIGLQPISDIALCYELLGMCTVCTISRVASDTWIWDNLGFKHYQEVLYNTRIWDCCGWWIWVKWRPRYQCEPILGPDVSSRSISWVTVPSITKTYPLALSAYFPGCWNSSWSWMEIPSQIAHKGLVQGDFGPWLIPWDNFSRSIATEAPSAVTSDSVIWGNCAACVASWIWGFHLHLR